MPNEAITVFKNMEAQGNPWGIDAGDRVKWAEGLDIPLAADVKDAEVLLWVGCGGALVERNRSSTRAMAQLLQKAGVKFAVLGRDEKCTGDPARRIGNEFLFESLAKENIETLGKHEVKTIVTSCPHCFNTLLNEYPHFGGQYEVFHHTTYLAQLIGEVVAVERLPITFGVSKGKGQLKIGSCLDAELVPFEGATGKPTTLHDATFSVIPGAPAYVGKSKHLTASHPKLKLNLNLEGKSSVQGQFVFEA